MRLSQITQHIKDQNWFAVSLDFLIVVVGILIAFQITNWNEASETKKKERQVLERLHIEIETAISTDSNYRTAISDRMLSNLLTARHVLFGISERTTLTADECQAISLSHHLLTGLISIPILNELAATGNIALIRDQTIVHAISETKEIVDNLFTYASAIESRMVVLSRQFPDLIEMTLKLKTGARRKIELDPYDPFYICNSKKMRVNPAFINSAGENLTTSFAFVELALVPSRQSLSKLHAKLETALSLSAE